MTIENRIYEKPGLRPRPMSIINWDVEAWFFTIEYIANGYLEDYIGAQTSEMSMTQRL